MGSSSASLPTIPERVCGKHVKCAAPGPEVWVTWSKPEQSPSPKTSFSGSRGQNRLINAHLPHPFLPPPKLQRRPDGVEAEDKRMRRNLDLKCPNGDTVTPDVFAEPARRRCKQSTDPAPGSLTCSMDRAGHPADFLRNARALSSSQRQCRGFTRVRLSQQGSMRSLCARHALAIRSSAAANHGRHSSLHRHL